MPNAIGQELDCLELYNLNITTNPDESVNERHPSFADQYFEWRTFWYDINWQANSNPVEYSPFYQPDNDIVDHLAGPPEKDFEPEDGWELINYNLGFDLQGNPIPNPRQSIYLVLYNRYHAKLRVFVLLGEQEGGYSNCRISVRHSSGTNAQFSGVLEGAGEYVAPLIEFDPNKVISSTSRHLNNNNSWSYAEFHLTYDPCACKHTSSRLVIEQSLIDIAAITLEGHSSGTIKPMLDENNPNNSNPDGAKNGYYRDFSGFFEEVDGAVSAGNKAFKTYEKWNSALDTDDADAKSGVTNLLGAFSDEDNLLGQGLRAIPYVSEAMAIIDFFVGGGESEPETVKMGPMSMDLNHTFDGTLTHSHPYNNIAFDLPGSSAQPYNGNPQEWYEDFSYPLYNKPLGIISILNRPKIITAATYNPVVYTDYCQNGYEDLVGGSRYTKRWFQFQNQLEYVVNPESGLEVEEVHGSIVTHLSNLTVDPTAPQHGYPEHIPDCPPSSIGNINDFSGGYHHIRDSIYASELLPLSCLHNLTLYTHEVYQKYYTAEEIQDEDFVTSGNDPDLMNYPSYDAIFLKLVFNMKRIDGNGNNVLLVYQVPMEITDFGNGSISDMGWSTEFADYLGEVETDTVIENETVENDLFLQNSIEASNTIFSSVPASDLSVQAGRSIEILPESEIQPQTALEINNYPGPCEGNALYPPLSLDYVLNNHCHDPRYTEKSKINMTSAGNGSPIGDQRYISGVDVNIFPNPVQAELNIIIFGTEGVEGGCTIQIYNVQGQLIYHERFDDITPGRIGVNVSQLQPGAYNCRVINHKGEVMGSEKFVKSL